MPGPPPLPTAPKNLRLARLLNLLVPGAGLFYLGRRRAGAVLASLFLLCFGVAIGIFLLAYVRYLSLAMSDDLLKGDQLERMGEIFPRAWLAGLALAGVGIYLVAHGMFRSAARSAGAPPADLGR